MGRLIEGLWDCNYCNTKGNRGSVRDCPNCGRPRDEDIKFYMPETINYVSEEEEKAINRNPDWLCPYCNSLNSDSLKNCPSCGSKRTSENLDYFSIKKEHDCSNELTDNFNQEINEIEDSICDQKNTMKNNIAEKLKFIPNFTKNHWKVIVSIPLILALIFIYSKE